MKVRKALLLCGVSLLAVALTAPASFAAYSTVTADGTVSWTGRYVTIQPQGLDFQYEWLTGDDAESYSQNNYFKTSLTAMKILQIPALPETAWFPKYLKRINSEESGQRTA